jgi:hypothetical protein
MTSFEEAIETAYLAGVPFPAMELALSRFKRSVERRGQS